VLLADLLDSIQEIEDFREILFTESDAIFFSIATIWNR